MSDTQCYALAVADRPDVLPRVVTTVRRRGGEIVALSYASGDRHRPGALQLTVRSERSLTRWLEGLVDVQEVRVAA
jgi:acetolactate synthase regulatory subunit